MIIEQSSHTACRQSQEDSIDVGWMEADRLDSAVTLGGVWLLPWQLPDANSVRQHAHAARRRLRVPRLDRRLVGQHDTGATCRHGVPLCAASPRRSSASPRRRRLGSPTLP